MVSDIPWIEAPEDLFDDRAGLEDRYDPHSMLAIGTTERIDLVEKIKKR